MNEADVFEEMRSEEVQELLTRQPAWALRWSITVIGLTLVAIFYITWLVRFPDLVPASFTLTSVNPPKMALARSSGRLARLLVTDGATVSPGTALAYLESTGRHDEVLRLSQDLRRAWVLANSGELEKMSQLDLEHYHALGELQNSYQLFVQSHIQLRAYLAHGFFAQKRKLLQQELAGLQDLAQNIQEQRQLQQKDVLLAEEEYKIQQQLARQRVIAPIDLKHEESKLMARRLPYSQTGASVITNTAQKQNKEKEILELDNAVAEQRDRFLQALNTLQSATDEWMRTYVVRSPSQGQVRFPRRWQENQEIETGQELFYITPPHTVYLGEVQIPQQNAGKVKVGQTVLIRFASYPDSEFGLVKGTIKTIAELPSKDGSFLAEVHLPEGLVTSRGQRLAYKLGMTASAQVVTKNKRLLQRLFEQVAPTMY
jgi:multidrug resistance efflux pump